MTIAERLNAIIAERKIVKKALCEACGFPPSNLSTWIGNNVTSIPSEYIMPICRFFDILPEKLLCDESDAEAVSAADMRLNYEEHTLIDLYRQADSEGKYVVMGTAVQEKRRATERESSRARA